MMALVSIIQRNVRFYFRDRGAFLSSLITPVVLLVLYATFLMKVYRDSLLGTLPPGIADRSLANAFAAGQMTASLLAVSTVTVPFMANMQMVKDRLSGASRDFALTPRRNSTFYLGYFLSTLAAAVIACLFVALLCLLYMSRFDAHLTAADTGLLLLDVALLALFGTSLSSLVIAFVRTPGQMTAVSAFVSSIYGFLCGAYMPIHSFSGGVRRVLSYFPGTYGTCLIRRRATRGVLAQMAENGASDDVLEELRRAFDVSLKVSGHTFTTAEMTGIVLGTSAALTLVYVLVLSRRRLSD